MTSVRSSNIATFELSSKLNCFFFLFTSKVLGTLTNFIVKATNKYINEKIIVGVVNIVHNCTRFDIHNSIT